MKIINDINIELGIEKKKITYIHRGRNKYLNDYFLRFCSYDYNYDFRGLYKYKYLNISANFFKSLITALEVKKNEVYIFEGGLHIVIAILIKIIYKPRLIILNIADPTLYQFNNSKFASIKFKIKKYLILNYFDVILTNSPNVILLLENKYNRKIFLYRLGIFKKKIENIKYIRNKHRDNTILFLISRPIETGYTKGLHVFIEIVRRMNMEDKQIKFIIAGSGVEEIEYDSPNLEKKPHFVNVGLAFQQAKILLCPSVYDSYPSVTIECLEYGVLPLVSNGTGSSLELREIDKNYAVDNDTDMDEWINKIKILLNYDLNKILENGMKAREFINNNFVRTNE
jgi:glycosyltransferase involved in cell wall biosynthesis